MGGMRRSGRIAKEIGIALLGTNTSGHMFSEETRTVALSRHGAGVLSRHRLAPDEVLTLRFLGGTSEAAVRLVGEMGRDARGYIYGVAFVDPDLDFWELKFPPPTKWHGEVNCALECSLCQTRDVVDQTEVEADVYALTQRILRFCHKCGTSTEWRRAAGDAVAHPVAPSSRTGATMELETNGRPSATVPINDVPKPASGLSRRTAPVQIAVQEPAARETLPPAATAVMAHTANRRRDVRTRVGFTVCIRLGAAGEEIVECDNISRGGLSFRSRRSYELESLIDVAAPYSPVNAIFVPARIKRVEQLPGGTLFRYGAAYIPKEKSS